MINLKIVKSEELTVEEKKAIIDKDWKEREKQLRSSMFRSAAFRKTPNDSTRILLNTFSNLK